MILQFPIPLVAPVNILACSLLAIKFNSVFDLDPNFVQIARHELRDTSIGFLMGILLTGLAIASVKSGRTWTRFYGWVYHKDHPKTYWVEVVGLFLTGIGVASYYLNKLITILTQ